MKPNNFKKYFKADNCYNDFLVTWRFDGPAAAVWKYQLETTPTGKRIMNEEKK